ncbi:MAG TPA: nickel-dependent hydrogenase large subunit, partial [Chroococcales cyanobacterium]
MTTERRKIELPEICRVEGHSAVTVDIVDGAVADVQLEVFEGTRFFERIVIGHKFDEIAHITSRVCAICSTGHVLAASYALERIFKLSVNEKVRLFRELMHLGMIIESHATHVCALALPDFLGCSNILQFATEHSREFDIWTRLRKLGAEIQTVVGGRPFHPINLKIGGFSHFPDHTQLGQLKQALRESQETALQLWQTVNNFRLPVDKTTETTYLALTPDHPGYGYFGRTISSSSGWTADVSEYKNYLNETVVPYSHAKRSTVDGKP